MYLKRSSCAIALIIAVFYCVSLSVPFIGPFIFVASPVKAADESCPSDLGNQGCLLITKSVVGSGETFTIDVVNVDNGAGGGAKDFVDGDTKRFLLNPGTYSITETSESGVGFTADFSGDCTNRRVTITTGGQLNCNVTNRVGVTVGSQGGQEVANENIQNEQVTGQRFAANAGVDTGAGKTLGIINPPFDTCFGNFLRNLAGKDQPPIFTPSLDRNQVGNLDSPELIRAPNAATYTAGGTIPLNDVLQALNKFNTKIITIQIYNDFQDGDPVALADSAPQFKGAIMVEDSEGVKHEVVNFNLYTIRTECKYITFAKPAGDAPNRNVYPLGVVGENDETSLSPVNQILVQQAARLGTSLNQGAPTVLNPPFATCDTGPRAATEPDFAKDDFGIYNVRGKINELGSLHGNDLHVEINVDLLIHKRDLAKITDNNNPYIRVNLIADEDKNSAHKIPFTFHDLWTDCKDLSLNNNPLFEPFQSEIIP